MTAETDSARLRTTLHGAVQGVGFRPFIHRLAVVLGLQGWVVNSAQGLVVEVEGGAPVLKEFQRRLVAEKPPSSVIQSIESVWLDPVGKSSKYHAHDEKGEYKMGDMIEITESRPISKTKNWVATRLVQKAIEV